MSPAAKQVRFHIFPVTGIVHEQKPQSFYTDVVDGVSSLVETVSDRLIPVVFYVSQVFLEAGVEDASRFANVEFGAFGAMSNVHDVLSLAVELFGDVHLQFQSLDADIGADEGHVLHFSWLQGVVPGVLVAGCPNFDCTSMSQMLVSRLYVVSDSRLKILAISMHACRRLQFNRMILHTRIVEGW